MRKIKSFLEKHELGARDIGWTTVLVAFVCMFLALIFLLPALPVAVPAEIVCGDVAITLISYFAEEGDDYQIDGVVDGRSQRLTAPKSSCLLFWEEPR